MKNQFRKRDCLCGNGKLDLFLATERVQFFADVVGIAPPSCLQVDGVPSSALLEWCDRTGLSLDWIFCGDLRPLMRAVFRARNDQLQ